MSWCPVFPLSTFQVIPKCCFKLQSMTFVSILGILWSQNVLGWRGLTDHLIPAPAVGRDVIPTPGYSGLCPSCPWTLPGLEHPHPLWTELLPPCSLPIPFSAGIEGRLNRAADTTPGTHPGMCPSAFSLWLCPPSGTLTSHPLLTPPSTDSFSVTFSPGKGVSFLRSQSIWEKGRKPTQNETSIQFHFTASLPMQLYLLAWCTNWLHLTSLFLLCQ